MKRKWLIAAVLWGMMAALLPGCGAGDASLTTGAAESNMPESNMSESEMPEPEGEEADSGQLSYATLEGMEEVSISGNRVVIVLEEDQALPYRFECQLKGEGVTLDQDYLVEEPRAELPNLSVGSSPAFRVYELSCEQGASAVFTVTGRHVTDDEVWQQRIYEIGMEQDTVWVK